MVYSTSFGAEADTIALLAIEGAGSGEEKCLINVNTHALKHTLLSILLMSDYLSGKTRSFEGMTLAHQARMARQSLPFELQAIRRTFVWAFIGLANLLLIRYMQAANLPR